MDEIQPLKVRLNLNAGDSSVPTRALIGEALDEIERLDAEVARLEKLVYVPGVWKCAKCAFSLISKTLYVNLGVVGANTSPQQCANGCGPMWRVTERDAGNEVCDRLEALTITMRETSVPKMGEQEVDLAARARVRELEQFLDRIRLAAKGQNDGTPHAGVSCTWLTRLCDNALESLAATAARVALDPKGRTQKETAADREALARGEIPAHIASPSGVKSPCGCVNGCLYPCKPNEFCRGGAEREGRASGESRG